jgi:hypothetical protein
MGMALAWRLKSPPLAKTALDGRPSTQLLAASSHRELRGFTWAPVRMLNVQLVPSPTSLA